MKRALATGAMALLLVAAGTGCSSTRTPEPIRDGWVERAEPADPESASYDARDLAHEWRELLALRAEVSELDANIVTLRRAFRFRPAPRVSQDLLDRASWLMLRHSNARGTLLGLGDFFAHSAAEDPAVRLEGDLLGLHAAIYRAWLDTRMVLQTRGNEGLIRALDAASPSLGIEPGRFRAIHQETTDPALLERLRVQRSRIDEALASEESALRELLARDPALADRHRAAMRFFDDALIQAQLVLYQSAHPTLDGTRDAEPGRFSRWWDRVGVRMGRNAYSMQGFVFTKVARIKDPRAHLLVFSPEHVRQLERLLEPGDLILTFTDGYVGNLFLPGVFKHGIIYVGSPEERIAVGLTEEALWRQLHDLRRFERLKKVAATAQTHGGRPADVVESLAEGVKFSSLEHLLATHVNRMVILRPRISQQERLEMLIAVFAYVGRQYDFDFDFEDPSRLYCTEMVYRVLQGKGALRFETTRIGGRSAFTADDLARHALQGPSGALEVIALVDRDRDRKGWAADIVTGPGARVALRRLMSGSVDSEGVRNE